MAITHYVIQGPKNGAVIDHATGTVVGRFDKDGNVNTSEIAENAVSGLMERIKSRFPRAYAVTLFVSDGSSSPVEGAAVTVEGDFSDLSAKSGETGDEGEFFVYLPAGEYTANVFADGYAAAEKNFSVNGENEEVEIELEAEGGDDN